MSDQRENVGSRKVDVRYCSRKMGCVIQCESRTVELVWRSASLLRRFEAMRPAPTRGSYGARPGVGAGRLVGRVRLVRLLDAGRFLRNRSVRLDTGMRGLSAISWNEPSAEIGYA